jgi:glycosyltransferase involved in cell wall biosynthesis
MRCRELPKPKICFCAFNAYPLLARANIEFIGGAELQQVLLGKELVKNGYDVSFIVLDYGQKSFETINGIKIYKTVPGGYLSGVKSIYFAVKCVWNALKQADADIYFQECAGYYTGFVALFCILKRRIFVFQLASDMDVDGTFIKNAKLYERMLYKFGIKRADCIIAQSDYQQKLLKKNYDRRSIVIKSPYPIEKIERNKSIPPIVLWAGSIKPKWKQPELFLKLAKAIPDARFQMVGGSSTNKQFYEQIKDDAEKIHNLEFVGFVSSYLDVNKYFNNASIFINTSTAEGFSNTFLQAWGAYTPVVSLNVDPDEIICRYKLGFHSKTFEKLIKDVKTLLKDETLRNRMGVNGRWYAESEHDIKKIVKKYAEIFEDVYERRR